MNRKIELRAFDNVFKKMYYSTFEQFDDMAGFRFDHFEDDSDLIYMQKTPFKDIEGKVIWEGDILKIFDIIIKVIVWDEEKGQFSYKDCNIIDSRISNFEGQHTLVIGNIYENKELLNEK